MDDLEAGLAALPELRGNAPNASLVKHLLQGLQQRHKPPQQLQQQVRLGARDTHPAQQQLYAERGVLLQVRGGRDADPGHVVAFARSPS